jgi:hypothetical protein
MRQVERLVEWITDMIAAVKLCEFPILFGLGPDNPFPALYL